MNASYLNKTLEQYNLEYRRQYYGAVVLLIILMVLGIVGNLHVLFIYTYRMKQTNQRIFILTIAVLDTVLCFVGIPFILVLMFHPLTFSLVSLCKTIRFVIYFCAGNSGTVLVLVAVNRYLKTCRPLGYQIRPKTAKRLCLMAISFGCFIFWPAPVLYGHHKVSTADPAIIGSNCDIDYHYFNTIYPTVWSCCITGIVILFIFVLIFLYYKIGMTVSRRLKHSLKSLKIHDDANKTVNNYCASLTPLEREHKSGSTYEMDSCSSYVRDLGFKSTPNPEDTCLSAKQNTTENDSDRDKHLFKTGASQMRVNIFDIESKDHLTFSESDNRKRKVLHENKGQDNCSKTESLTDDITYAEEVKISKDEEDMNITKDEQKMKKTEDPEEVNNVIKTGSKQMSSPNPLIVVHEAPDLYKLQRIRRSRRITFMFFVLTVVYFITFIPHLAMHLAFVIQTDFVNNLTYPGKVVYHIMYMFAFLSSSVNCYIYGFFDMSFRLELKKIYIDGYNRCKGRFDVF